MSAYHDPVFTPEQEVLLWSIRVDHALDERVAVILKAGISWDYLRETAARHKIIPLLYKRLKGEMRDLVPSPELAKLQILFRKNAARNIRMTQQLLSVLDLLADHRVPSIPYKGPALAILSYRDLSMRSFSDLDILIHPADLLPTYRILNENGYVMTYQNKMTIERKFAFLDQKDLHFTYQGESLEVHWKVIEPLFAVLLDMDGIWDRSRPVLLNGREITTISPEDMIIILCLHGHKHGWQSLGWLADLVYTISNHPGLSWQDLLLSAEKLGLRRIVLTSLYLAHKHGGVRFGPDIQNLFFTDRGMQNLVQVIQQSMFQSEELAISPLFYLKSRERLSDKVRFLVYYLANRFLVFVRWVIRPFTKKPLSY